MTARADLIRAVVDATHEWPGGVASDETGEWAAAIVDAVEPLVRAHTAQQIADALSHASSQPQHSPEARAGLFWAAKRASQIGRQP